MLAWRHYAYMGVYLGCYHSKYYLKLADTTPTPLPHLYYSNMAGPGPTAGTSSHPQLSWESVSARKKAEQQSILNRFPDWRLPEVTSPDMLDISTVVLSRLSDRERQIVAYDAVDLVDRIKNREYTAVEVLTAFCKVATAAHETTNCLTEIFFEEGLRRAEELDNHLEITGQVVGPLHGLPISVKDHILLKGSSMAAMYIKSASDGPSDRDAPVIAQLRRAGAVFYVKTNLPQTLMSIECDNHTFGRTVNPYNRNLSSGGSTGGEGSLIACRGSPLGLGTDIGGSVRIPSAYCGIYGLKPSVGRLPKEGISTTTPGNEFMQGVLGPMASSARSLALYARVLLDGEPWLAEPAVLPMPWQQSVIDAFDDSHKISVAILWDDGIVAPHPPIYDAMRKMQQALVASGHEVIDWEPVDHLHASNLIIASYFPESGSMYRDAMAGVEPAIPQTEWILSLAHLLGGGKTISIQEGFKLNVAREAFCTKIAEHWNNTSKRTTSGKPVDVVLCPTAPTLAAPHDTSRWLNYTSYWNLLDYSAVVFPVGRLTPEAVPSLNAYPRDAPRNATEEFISAQWNAETYMNAPISLQIVGRRLQEEKVLGVLNLLEALL